MITPNVSPICALVRQNNEAPLTESRYDFGYMTLFIGSHVKVILPRWDIIVKDFVVRKIALAWLVTRFSINEPIPHLRFQRRNNNRQI